MIDFVYCHKGRFFILKKKINCLLIGLFVSLLTVGCGSTDAELDAYKTEMETFFTQVADLNDGINEIDASSETANEDMLAYLDQLNTAFSDMASYTVPDEFAAVTNLATEASENMNKAVNLYHDVLGSETFNENTAEAAHEYYERANIRIQYIIQILHGEIPEGENVTYSYDDGTSTTESATE